MLLQIEFFFRAHQGTNLLKEIFAKNIIYLQYYAKSGGLGGNPWSPRNYFLIVVSNKYLSQI